MIDKRMPLPEPYRMDGEIQTDNRYTIDQIMDALIQADGDVITAIRYQDREMLRDLLVDYLA